MTTNQQIATEYYNIISIKIDDIKTKIAKVRRNLTFNEGIILDNEIHVYPNPILDYVKRIRNKQSNYNKYKIDELFKFDNDDVKYYSTNLNRAGDVNKVITNIIPIRYRTHAKDEIDLIETIIATYLNFYKYVLKYHDLHEELYKYEPLQLEDYAIQKFLRRYFTNAGELILREHHAKFRVITGVYVYVFGKSRISSNRAHTEPKIRNKVDWGLTNKNLKEIAKDKFPEIYAKLADGLTKKAFYNQLKPYLYNKEDNPNGIHYLVYLDKDINHWLMVDTKYCKTKGKSGLKGIRDFGIVPTNHIDTEARSQIDFANNVKSVNEIIYNSKLGFRDKIRILERYDLRFCQRNYLNNIHNDLQVS